MNVSSYFTGKTMMFIVIFIIILIIIIYISAQHDLLKKNCGIIGTYLPMPGLTDDLYTNEAYTNLRKQPIKNLYIKTAYNCCCTGHFRNDYIDNFKQNGINCALKNCAQQGVRALDFTIYSMKDTLVTFKPVISASSVVENTYKEMYNHSDFDSTMSKVNEYFLLNSNNTSNSSPLFLIFRVFSTTQSIYDSIGTILTSTFSNALYIAAPLTTNTTLNDLEHKRVVIIIEPFTDNVNDPRDFIIKSPTLGPINPLILDSAELYPPCINRLSYISSTITKDVRNQIILLYPDLYNWNNKNYDSVTNGFNNNIPFIAMNFQNQDQNYVKYMAQFNIASDCNGSFCIQTQTI